MKIINKKISELKEYENNPRNNIKAVTPVMNSIREFGFRVPIVIDIHDVIVCGHTRLKAAKMLKMKEVPCVVADDLTEAQIKAFRLVDNKSSEFAEWDFERLDKEIKEMTEFDMTAFGFVEEEDLNIDDFFLKGEQKEKQAKGIQCPHCGQWFEK